MKIGFIGAGNIAEAMIRGIITSGHLDPGKIVISDINQDRLNKLNQSLGTMVAENNIDNAKQVNALFIAVKPAQIFDVASEIKNHVKKETFIISLVAGKSLESIKSRLNKHSRICRIMPNLAASVRKSTITLFTEKNITASDLHPLHSLLSCAGKVFQIEDEKLMASITALSGSAPAYYVMMADALIKYGISQGMDQELAKQMILATMEGTASWALNSKIPLEHLWKQVVTPGGTTEAGINHYNENRFIEIFVEGLDRATERAREMGDNKNSEIKTDNPKKIIQ